MEEIKEPITEALQTKCEFCGEIIEYSPIDKDPKCLNCGKTTELERKESKIKENDFNYWKDISYENNLEHTVKVTIIKCGKCGAITTLEPIVSASKCVFCSSPLFLEEAAEKRFWKPDCLFPFKLSEKERNDNFKKCLRKKLFLPSQIKKGGISSEMFKGMFLPYWVYDANTFTKYTGERGEDRTETIENDKQEKTTQTITDWYPTWNLDDLIEPFENIVVPSTKSLPNYIINKLIVNLDMMNSVAYSPEFVAGSIIEIYQVDFIDGVKEAKREMDKVIHEAILSDIDGDKKKISDKKSQYNDLMFKLLLLPIWIIAFHFKGKLYQLVVNGLTGQVIGKFPKSVMKIAVFIIIIIAIIAIIMTLILIFR